MDKTTQKIKELIKAKTPYIYIVSDEEMRISEDIIANIAKPMNREVYIWTSNSGLINYETREDKKCKQFAEAMNEIINMKISNKKAGAIFLMLDPHVHINPSSARILKDGYVNIMLGKNKDMIDNPDSFKNKIGTPKNVIFIAGRVAHVSSGLVDGLEPTIKTQVEVVDFQLPTRQELMDLINKFIESGKKTITSHNLDYSKEQVAEMARSLQGLTFLEAQRAITESLVNEKQLNNSRLLEKKRSIVRQDDILEVIWNPPDISKVGGLSNLKQFAEMYKEQFSEEAEEYGVEPLRGILLVGVPGCLHGNTPIYDPVDKTTKTIEQRFIENKEFNVFSLSNNGPIIAKAEKPIRYKKEKMIEFTLNNGKKITVTPGHRFWTQDGWKTSSEVYEQLQANGTYLLPSSSECDQLVRLSDDQSLIHKAQDFQSCYHHEFHSYDEQLHPASNIDQDVFPLQDGVLLFDDDLSHKDDRVDTQEHNHLYRQLDHLSKQDFYVHNSKELKHQNVEETFQHDEPKSENTSQFLSETFQKDTSLLPSYLSQESKSRALSSSYTLQHQYNSLENESEDAFEFHTHQEPSQHSGHLCQPLSKLGKCSSLVDRDQEPSVFFQQSNLPYNPPVSDNINYKDTKMVIIKQAKYVEDAVYYDFHVPTYENYAACGIWHHNTGKSLSVKSISKLWNIPCLRLDIGKVMSGIVGSSEQRMRQVIKVCEAAAPCVTGDTEVIIFKDGKKENIKIEDLYDKYHNGKIGPIFQLMRNDNHYTNCYGILRRSPGKNRIVEIETENGNCIKVTENHKLLVKRGNLNEWVEARKLTLEDDLVELKNKEEKNE